jgi:hypothetical protein
MLTYADVCAGGADNAGRETRRRQQRKHYALDHRKQQASFLTYAHDALTDALMYADECKLVQQERSLPLSLSSERC